MLKRLSICLVFVLGFVLLLTAESAKAQLGNSGSIEGAVKDDPGGVVGGATVEISYAVSGFLRETTTGSDGSFKFTNVPLNTYHLLVAAGGFANYTQDVDVRSGVPVTLQIGLKIGTAATSVTVEAQDLVENESTFHTDIDRGLFERLPLESASSSVSSLVTLASPGAIADSNGLVHAIGDHAETSFSVDNQPITDQTSKVFSHRFDSITRSDLRRSARRIWGQNESSHQGDDALRPRSDETSWQREGFLWELWLNERWFRRGVWRSKVGQFHRGERFEHGPLPGSPGVPSHPFQGQPAERIRPRGPSAYRYRFRAFECGIYEVLVPNA